MLVSRNLHFAYLEFLLWFVYLFIRGFSWSTSQEFLRFLPTHRSLCFSEFLYYFPGLFIFLPRNFHITF